jgi:uncharacterized membrane protein YfcA
LEDWLVYVAIGFVAQLIDGALGMAYGVSATSFLLAAGVPPVTASATVHMAETFTTGVSALSHNYFGNVDRRLFRSLVVPGMIGAAIGAYVLVSLPGERLRPWIAGYICVMGVVVFLKAFRTIPPVSVTTHLAPLGFTGALIDSLGGGGWGPIVASTLLARGNVVRTTIGSVNAAEFFVTLTSSLTFLLTVGLGHWPIVLALGLGGAVAAPIGAWACRRLPHKPMLAVIGLLIVALSARTLWRALGS